MTVVAVLRDINRINEGEIVELSSTFLPAPGIEIMKTKGYAVWTLKVAEDNIKTYFLK